MVSVGWLRSDGADVSYIQTTTIRRGGTSSEDTDDYS